MNTAKQDRLRNNDCINRQEQKFNIQQLTKLVEDPCYIDVRNKESVGPGQYELSNYYDCLPEAPVSRDVWLQQPAINFYDGYGWTTNKGANIDSDSRLRNARNLTHLKYRQQLFQRPYATVPYMGRGVGDVCAECFIRTGEDTAMNKPCNTLSGIYIDRFDPQVPLIKNNIQNPIHIIEEDNDTNWIRGGQPSRQVIRNKDYLKKCGYEYNGKYWVKV